MFRHFVVFYRIPINVILKMPVLYKQKNYIKSKNIFEAGYILLFLPLSLDTSRLYKFDKTSNDFGLGSYIHDLDPTIELSDNNLTRV